MVVWAFGFSCPLAADEHPHDDLPMEPPLRDRLRNEVIFGIIPCTEVSRPGGTQTWDGGGAPVYRFDGFSAECNAEVISW